MTFKDVIFKNFTGGIRRYLSYFLSGLFCVAMLFVYSTLILLDNVSNEIDDYPMAALFVITCIMISLFSIFFINYSHQSFISNKKKELGIYMIIGMDENSVRKMLAVETGIIALASIISGMITGALFARLFQMIIMKLVGIEDMSYKLSPVNFIVTAGAFLIIYALCFFISDRQLGKEDVSGTIKDERKKQGKPYRKIDSILFVLGIIFVIFSVVFTFLIAKDEHLNSKMWVVITFVITGYGGLFLTILCGGKTLINKSKLSKKYYNRMLYVSDIDQKFQENIKIIIILTMLASMIVLLVGSPFALVNISADIAEEGNQDVEYAVIQTKVDENVGAGEIWDKGIFYNIFPKSDVKAHDVYEMSLVYDEKGSVKPVTSVSDYNNMMDSSLLVQPGYIYNMIITWIPGNQGLVAGDKYTLDLGSEYTGSSNEISKEFIVADSVKGDWKFMNLFKAESLLILSDTDYAKLKDNMLSVKVSSVQLKAGWKNTEKKVKKLREELGTREGKAFVNSRIENYISLKKGYSVFLFISCSMCLMFFVSTGCVLYFKQYNDIDDEKKQYKKLFNLGISDKTVKKCISEKMAVVYFVTLIGSIMGIVIMYYLASLFGGDTVIKVFMSKGILGFIFYAASQLTFYLMLRFRYINDVLK